MKVKISHKLILRENDTVILLVPANQIKENVPAELRSLFDKADLTHFSGKDGETAHILLRGQPCIILAGFGSSEKVNPESIRNAASAALKVSIKLKRSSLQTVVPAVKGIDEELLLSAVTEGILLSNYSFSKYFFKKERSFSPDELVLISNSSSAKSIIERSAVICDNVQICRNLVNDTSDNTNPEKLVRYAQTVAKKCKLKVKVFNADKIEKMGMGLLSAVGRGSAHGPFFVILSYNGNLKSKKSIAVIGKGVTFDSGGLNLKTSGHIEDMRSDMAGAAAALCAIKTAAELKLRVNVHAVLPLTENMITNSSYRPGDVFKAYNGTTVEIANTDAEGRLILADAVSYTARNIKPSYIVEMSTLTGACITAFGEIYAASITSGGMIDDLLSESSEATSEKIWKMPTDPEFDEDMKSDIADLRNVNPERKAGTIFGGSFILSFSENIPFAHLDIAGTSWYSKERGYRPKYATGYGVRLIIELISRISRHI
jgi:leucyl aminopeptidase